MSMDRSASLAIPGFVLIALAIIVVPMILRDSNRRQHRSDRPVLMTATTARDVPPPQPSQPDDVDHRKLVSQEVFHPELPPVPVIPEDEIIEREQKLDAALVAIASTYDDITTAQGALAASRIEEAQLSEHVLQLEDDITRLNAALEPACEAQGLAQFAIDEFSATLVERRARTRQIADAARKEAHSSSLDKIARERREREERRQRLGTLTDSQSEILHSAMLKRRARLQADLKSHEIVSRDETEIAAVIAQRTERMTESEQLLTRLTTERETAHKQLVLDNVALTSVAINVVALTARCSDLRNKLGTLSELKQNRELAVPIARLEERRRQEQTAAARDREQALFAPRTATEFGVWRPAGFSPLQDSPVFVTRQIAHAEPSPVAAYFALHRTGRVAAMRRAGVGE